MARKGLVGSSIVLEVKFYQNAVLFDPFSVSNVEIFSVPSGGTSIATLGPTRISTGVYRATWSIPTTQTPGKYYDEWTFVAYSGLDSDSQRLEFQVTTQTTLVTQEINSFENRLQVLEKNVEVIVKALSNLVTRKELKNVQLLLTKTDDDLEDRVGQLEVKVG